MMETMIDLIKNELSQETSDFQLTHARLRTHVNWLLVEVDKQREVLEWYAQMKFRCESKFCDSGERARKALNK